MVCPYGEHASRGFPWALGPWKLSFEPASEVLLQIVTGSEGSGSPIFSARVWGLLHDKPKRPQPRCGSELWLVKSLWVPRGTGAHGGKHCFPEGMKTMSRIKILFMPRIAETLEAYRSR